MCPVSPQDLEGQLDEAGARSQQLEASERSLKKDLQVGELRFLTVFEYRGKEDDPPYVVYSLSCSLVPRPATYTKESQSV